MSHHEDVSFLEEYARPSVRDYTLLTLGSLLVVTVVLVQEDLGWWAALPLLIGAISVLTAWTVGPALVLLAVMLVLNFAARGAGAYLGELPIDPVSLVLAVCLLV